MPTTSGDALPVPPMSLAARFLGIITAPKDTFRSVVAHPRWFGMLALTTVIVAVASAVPLMTEAGRQAGLDNQVAQMQSFGMQVNDQMYASLRAQSKYAPYTAMGGILVFAPLLALVMNGILFLVFNAIMGGEASFKQLFAVWAHSGVVSSLGPLFTAPLNLARGAVGSATNLGVLLPMLDEGSFVGKLMGMIDLFVVWWVIVLAMGLGVLYRRRTQPIAVGLFVVYAVIAVGVAAAAGIFGRLRGA